VRNRRSRRKEDGIAGGPDPAAQIDLLIMIKETFVKAA
jgi:hypothetical protein